MPRRTAQAVASYPSFVYLQTKPTLSNVNHYRHLHMSLTKFEQIATVLSTSNSYFYLFSSFHLLNNSNPIPRHLPDDGCIVVEQVKYITVEGYTSLSTIEQRLTLMHATFDLWKLRDKAPLGYAFYVDHNEGCLYVHHAVWEYFPSPWLLKQEEAGNAIILVLPLDTSSRIRYTNTNTTQVNNMTDDKMPSISDMLKSHNEAERERAIDEVIKSSNAARENTRSGKMSSDEEESLREYLRDKEGKAADIKSQQQELSKARETAQLEREIERQQQRDLGIYEENGEYYRDGRYCDKHGNFL